MRTTRGSIIFVILCVAASRSYADDWNSVCAISPYAQYQFNAPYGEASVSISRVGIDFDHSFSLNARTQITSNVKLEDSVYNFNDFRHEAPGVKTPIDQALLLRWIPSITYSINETWFVRGGLIGQASGQTGADFGDSLSFGVLGMVIHKFSDTLSIGIGAAFYTQLEDSATILPIESIDWQINEKWVLSGHGTEVRIAYFTRPELNYYLAGSYDTRQYRLEDSAAFSAGVLNDDAIPIRLGVQWLPTKQITVAGEVGAIAWQELEFENDHGDRILKDDVGPAIFLGFQFRYQF